MSEDKVNENKDSDLVKEIEQLKNEKAAVEMKLRRSDEDLYSEDYLAYLQEKKEKQPSQNSFMSGGRLNEYSEDELKEVPINKLVGLIAGEVYSQIRNENQRDMTEKERKVHKKKVANARVEIKQFAKDHSDFRDYIAKIDELSDANPNLNIEQLYVLAGGKLEEKPPDKQKAKEKEPPPNTRPQNEGGMKQSDKNLSTREIIAQEYQKLK
jgi:septal ring factor EnvC (AmiA/AmiB activator)